MFFFFILFMDFLLEGTRMAEIIDRQDFQSKERQWEERLEEKPEIDIDQWTLLLEARIIQA